MQNHNSIFCFRGLAIFVGCLAFFTLTAVSVRAQDEQSRSITSDDFASQRPPAQPRKPVAGKAAATAIRRARYKQIQQAQYVARRKRSGNSNPRLTNNSNVPAASAKISEIGVTIWRLRPPRGTDAGPKFAVQLPDGSRPLWTPERVSANTVFNAGDKIRLAVESAVAGHLYVVDSEIYANGAVGDPFLIFPGAANEDNTVRPGLLVEIPDGSEQLSYFNMTPKGNGYAGEMLTVIVSPRPLTNLKTDANGRITNADNLADLEENTLVELYAKTDGAGETYSAVEAQSTCQAKTRQLTREKPQPCAASRQLTREEPLPQNIYRVKTAAGQPAVLFVRLQTAQ